MDYLRIGESKLKITLTKDELLFYGMDLAALDYASTETRRAFWAILDDAKHATGFDAAACKVCVQIYTCKTGGCEMFVTAAPSAVEALTIADDKTMALTVCGVLPRLYAEVICHFDTLSKLLTVCKILAEQGYNCDSSAWQMSEHMNAKQPESYYLYLAGNQNERVEGRLNASSVLAEYGMPLPELNLSYLSEHCTPLVSEHAVEQLAKLAV